jgi:excisionase family DNA binding protein
MGVVIESNDWGTGGERLLKAKDIQAILGVGRTKAYEMMASGELPVIRVGDRSPRVPASELKKWLAQRTTGGLSKVA